MNRLTLLNLTLPELRDFKGRRVAAFKKNLIELAELELKHAKVGGQEACTRTFHFSPKMLQLLDFPYAQTVQYMHF